MIDFSWPNCCRQMSHPRPLPGDDDFAPADHFPATFLAVVRSKW
jgi:hypothetical protein